MGNAIIVEPINLPAFTTGSTPAAGTARDYLNNDWIGTVYRGTSVGTENFAVDFGSARTVDTIAFLSAASQLLTQRTQAGTSFNNGSVFDTGVATFAAGSVVPTSGRLHSLLVRAPASAQFWSFAFTIASQPFEAGRLVMGNRIELARNFSFGAAFGARDGGGGTFSPNGVWLPTPGRILRTVGLTWSFATKQEAEEQIQPLLERIGNGKHILLVTDPDTNVLRQRRMYFGPVQGNLETVWRTAGAFELRCNLISTI